MGVGAGDLQRCLPTPTPLCVRWFCRDLNQSASIQPGPSTGAAVKEAARWAWPACGLCLRLDELLAGVTMPKGGYLAHGYVESTTVSWQDSVIHKETEALFSKRLR